MQSVDARTNRQGRMSRPWLSRPRLDEAFTIETIEEASYLRVQVSGDPGVARLVSTLHVLGVQSEGAASTRVLVDLRSVESRFEPRELATIGREVACSFTHVTRLGFLVRTDQLTGIAERTARRSGVNLRVFDLESLALDWLKIS